MRNILTISFLLVLGVFLELYAQGNVQIEEITPENGLSYRTVSDIIQDKNDFIWFATGDGINRFDGSNWVVFKHIKNDTTSISHNSTSWIWEDPEHNLLIGTEGGINIYNPEINQFSLCVYNNFDSEKEIISTKPLVTSSGAIFVIAQVIRNHELILLTYIGKGKFKRISNLLIQEPDFNFDRIFPLWEGKSGSIWFADTKAFYQISMYDFSIKTFYFNQFSHSSKAQFQVAIPTDTRGRFWFPSPKEREDIFQFLHLPALEQGEKYLGFFKDNKGTLWFKTNLGIKSKFDLSENQFITDKHFPIKTAVNSVFEDKHGNIWIAHDFGVTMIRVQTNYFENYLADPQYKKGRMFGVESPYTMLEDKEGNLVFIDGYKITHLNVRKGSISKISFPLKDWTIKMIQDPAGNFWYPQKTALVKYDPASQLLTPFPAPGELASLEIDGTGKIWLTENPGGRCFIFDPGKEAFEVLDINDFPFLTNTMKMDGDQLWISSLDGLLNINTKSRIYRHYKLLENRRYYREWIYSILPYGDKLWLGTAEGLWCYDLTTENLTIYTKEDGLPHDIIYTVLPDGDYLWLGTHHGLCRFNIKDQTATNYFETDGLTNNEFNRGAALKSRDSKFYFGGLNGISSFRTKELEVKEQRLAPGLAWTYFSRWDDSEQKLKEYDYYELKPDSALTLDYRNIYLTFKFALLNFADPNENNYFYYLEGYEKNWRKGLSQSTIEYINIPPGKYVLKVKATDPFGTISQNELAIPLNITGPWYSTWWSIILLVLGIVAIGLAIRRYEIKLQQNKIESKNSKKLSEARNKLFSNITHEFRTPLTVIKGMTDEIKGHVTEKELIRRNSNLLLRLINQLLNITRVESGALKVHLENGNIIIYIKYLVDSFQYLANAKSIRLIFYSEVDEYHMDFDEEKIHHIISNLIHNAITYTGDGGQILIHINVKVDPGEQEMFILKIKDTGIGILENDLPHIFDMYFQVFDQNPGKSAGSGIGLSLTKELVILLGGQIEVKSQLGIGSEFIISLPVERNRKKKDMKEQLLILEERSYLNKHMDEPDLMFQGATRSKGIFGISDNPLPVLLIIEDNSDVIFYLQSILVSKYSIHIARDGSIGIKKAREIIPDIIISDVMMPEKNGYEVCQVLKDDIVTSHIPILLLTAKVEKEDLMTGLRQGADAYLTKPFQKDELLARVENLVEIRKKLQQKYLSGISGNGTVKESKEDLFLKKVDQEIENNLVKTDLNVELFSKSLGMSRSQLFRKIKALTGHSISTYIRSYKLKIARKLLETTDMNVSQVAYEVGFNDLSYFSTKFKEEFGEVPSSLK